MTLEGHLRIPVTVFMTIFVVHPEAIIWGQLLKRPRLLTGKLCYFKSSIYYIATVYVRVYGECEMEGVMVKMAKYKELYGVAGLYKAMLL